MRERFSRLLTDAAKKDSRILLLTGDHGYALFDEFRRAVPDQYINCGIAEQNMVGVAAGLAKAGFRPIVYGLAAFMPMRVLEQIKMDVCYEELPVIFIGDGAGVVYGQLGASHQCAEDIAALRAVPHMEIYAPCDRAELSYVFDQMIARERPAYLRFGKADLGDVHDTIPALGHGDLVSVLNNNAKAALIACGSMVKPGQAIANDLGLDLWSAPVLAPFNEKHLNSFNYDIVFTLEEHSKRGGLGGLVAEILAEGGKTKVIRFGIDNKFSDLCGDYAYLMQRHGLDIETITTRIRHALG